MWENYGVASDFLTRTIDLVQPSIIVTLGTVALEALKLIHYHEFTLKNDAAKVRRWNDRLLIPLYHPSPQVLVTSRKEQAQLRDYQVVSKAIKKLERGHPARNEREARES